MTLRFSSSPSNMSVADWTTSHSRLKRDPHTSQLCKRQRWKKNHRRTTREKINFETGIREAASIQPNYATWNVYVSINSCPLELHSGQLSVPNLLSSATCPSRYFLLYPPFISPFKLFNVQKNFRTSKSKFFSSLFHSSFNQ